MEQTEYHVHSDWEPRIVHRVGRESLPEAVRRSILELIRSSELPDRRLPREDQLADTLNVSRSTVRDALKMLEREAIVARKHGVGTFVNPSILESGIALNRLVTFTDLIEDGGHKAAARVTSARFRSLEAHELSSRLPSSTQRVIEVDKIYSADDQPIIFVRDLFPVNDEQHATIDLSNIRTSVFEFVREYLDEEIDHTLAEIDIVAASDVSAFSEPIIGDDSSPLLHLREIHYTSLGAVLGYSTVLLNPKGPVTPRILRRN